MANPDHFVGEFELMVLLAIARLGDDARAIDVRHHIQEHTGRKVSRGGLYVTLERLENKGFVRWSTEEAVPGRRGVPRRVFRVTGDGLEAVRTSHAAIISLARGLEGLLRR